MAQLLNATPLICYNAFMPQISHQREKSGQFAPGQSGNPGGRLKDEHRVAELARSFTVEAINTLVDLMSAVRPHRPFWTAVGAGRGRKSYRRPEDRKIAI